MLLNTVCKTGYKGYILRKNLPLAETVFVPTNKHKYEHEYRHGTIPIRPYSKEALCQQQHGRQTETFAPPSNGSDVTERNLTERGWLPVDTTALVNKHILICSYDKFANLTTVINTYLTRHPSACSTSQTTAAIDRETQRPDQL